VRDYGRCILVSVLLLTLLVQVAATIAGQSIGPLAPAIRSSLDLSGAQVGLLVTGSFVGATALMLPAGYLADRTGARYPFLAGPLVIGAGLAGAATAGDYPHLLGWLAFAGLGNGLTLPATTRGVMDWFPATVRGTAMSVKQAGLPVAGTVAALVMPAAAAAHGWRPAVAMMGAAIAAAGVAAFLVYRDPDERRASGQSPASPRELFVSAPFVCLLGYVFLLAGAQLTFISFLVLYLHGALGMALVPAAALLAAAQATGALARVGWGVLSDRAFATRRRPALRLIAAMTLLASLGLALERPGLPALSALLVVAFGVAGIGWNGVTMAFVAERSGRRHASTGSGIALTAGNLGILVLPPLFGLLVDRAGGFGPGFLLLAALSAAAMVLTLPLPNR
jgi:MFS transporter, ACS family, hexuronate transporter